MSQRAVKYAQSQLQATGWISKDTLSRQRKLNRDGAYFLIDLAWSLPREQREATPVVNGDKTTAEFAPPVPETAPVFAPPIENKETSIERNQDQKTHETEPLVSGVCRQEGEGTQAKETALPPTLSRIVVDDLRRFSRLEALYFEAIDRGWLRGSEAMALNFVAAAVRAREVGHDPARLFVSLVQRGLWPHITQAQEEYARRALQRWRENHPDGFRLPPAVRTMPTEAKEPLAA